MDKTQTQELTFSLRIILIGIIFWVIKLRYFTFFWLQPDHLFNVIGLEIIGTILILIGIIIIHRVYPFAYSSITIVLNWIILGINIVEIFNFFIFKSYFFYQFQKYTPFIMALMLFFISKLYQSGIKYFGNVELSKRWEYVSLVIFFGFSLPFYVFVTMEINGILVMDPVHLTLKAIILFIPIMLVMLFLFFYYLHTIITTFKYLIEIKKKG